MKRSIRSQFGDRLTDLVSNGAVVKINGQPIDHEGISKIFDDRIEGRFVETPVSTQPVAPIVSAVTEFDIRVD